MEETVQTGGLKEIHYPKGYKPELNEADEMRSKSIREYYEQQEKKKYQMNKVYSKIKLTIVLLIVLLLILFFILKL